MGELFFLFLYYLYSIKNPSVETFARRIRDSTFVALTGFGLKNEREMCEAWVENASTLCISDAFIAVFKID